MPTTKRTVAFLIAALSLSQCLDMNDRLPETGAVPSQYVQTSGLADFLDKYNPDRDQFKTGNIYRIMAGVDTRVATFVETRRGPVAITWLSDHGSFIQYSSIADAIAVHGHAGTRFVYTDGTSP